MDDKLGYGHSRQSFGARPARCQAIVASASSLSDSRGVLSVRTNFGQNEVPVFNTYEEFHKTVLQSFENISIVLNIDGKIVFISQNVSSLLGHRPEDIVGETLLNILLDEEKEEISQKVILNLPLAKSVGNVTEFCCYVRKGNAGQDAQDPCDYGNMYEGRDTYEYVKFILYLQDAYDESFVFFGNYGPNSRNIWSSTPRLLWEQQYYLVGTISVLCIKAESKNPVEIQPAVKVVKSDDDSNVQHHRLPKRRKMNEIQRNCKAKNLNLEYPESVTKVEIVDIRPATRQTPFELVQISPPSQSSTCTIISEDMSTSTTTSISSIEFSATSFSPVLPSAASTFEQDSTIDPKSLLEPVDMEFEVGPECLLKDSQEEQASPEQGECSNKDVKKPLEETMGSNPKEHVIDKVPGASSDEDHCAIVQEIEVNKGPKIQEPIVDQRQGHQKTVEPAPKGPSTVVQPVRPEAVVEPRVRTDLPACVVTEPRRVLPSQRPLLGERFAQLGGTWVRTPVYDLTISRSFHEEPPSYSEDEEEEREQEQCENELTQHSETLGNIPYEQTTTQQQMGQEQENQVYQPQDQPRRVLPSQRPLLGERFAQLGGTWVRTPVYDLTISRSFHEEPPSYSEDEEEEREQEQCENELTQHSETLGNIPYEQTTTQQQMGQEQENQVYQPQDQPRRVLPSQRPLLGERFAQLGGTWVRTPVYDLTISRSFHEEPPSYSEDEEEEREQEQCENELTQHSETLGNIPYEQTTTQQQMGQEQENQVYQPQDQPRRVLPSQRPLLGERFAQLGGTWVRTPVYDLTISRSFHEEPPSYSEDEEEEREQEQCENELTQHSETLGNIPYEQTTTQQQMGQEQENQVYQPQDQPRRVLPSQRPLLGERFAQLGGTWVRTPVYDLTISRSFHEEPPSYSEDEEEEREQEQCENELTQHSETLGNIPYEQTTTQQQMGQEQENQVYQPQDQPRRVLPSQRPLLGERFAQLGGTWVRTPVYDLTISRSFHEEPPSYSEDEEEEMEQEQCEYELTQHRETLGNIPYEQTTTQQQMGQEQEYQPRRVLPSQRPLLGERFAQLGGTWVRTPVYDLTISRSFHEEPPSYSEDEEEEREQEQCEYELTQHRETLGNLPYERTTTQQHMGQEQENQVYQPGDQVVTVTNDLAPLPINFFGTDYSEYPRNETQRFWDDHADHTPPLLHHPLTSSCQTTPVPHQPVAATFQPLAGTNHPSARSQHSSARSHIASSNYQRENEPHPIPPGQENSGYFQTEENIDSHP